LSKLPCLTISRATSGVSPKFISSFSKSPPEKNAPGDIFANWTILFAVSLIWVEFRELFKISCKGPLIFSSMATLAVLELSLNTETTEANTGEGLRFTGLLKAAIALDGWVTVSSLNATVKSLSGRAFTACSNFCLTGELEDIFLYS
jgi:hypothetical protein